MDSDAGRPPDHAEPDGSDGREIKREAWDPPRLVPLDLSSADTGTFFGVADKHLGPKTSWSARHRCCQSEKISDVIGAATVSIRAVTLWRASTFEKRCDRFFV